MIEINARQGTDEWLLERAKYHTASEAPIMMGVSKKATRADLLRLKVTGDEQEHSRWVKEVLFERGHEVEALARPIAEKIVGEELYPVTATDDDGYLLASFDGITMLEDVIWECKQWNEAKATQVRDGDCPEEDYWQVVQQLSVSGAERCLYMVSDGTEDRTVYCWVEPNANDIEHVRACWQQFDKDLAEWKPAEPTKHVDGDTPEDLPVLRVQVTGSVTASNLDEYRERALAIFRGINTDLQTDQDFATAETTVKWCKGVEQKIEQAKEATLAQTADIDQVMRTLDELREECRKTRLGLEKSVKSEKEQRRSEIAHAARQQLQSHIDEINAGLGKVQLPEIPCDIAGAMKGKKTIDSLRAAADQAVADAKIEASRIGQKMQSGLAVIREEAAGYEGLFRDAQSLVQKDAEDLRAVIRDRIREQQEAEAERERQRKEREERLAAEAERAASQAQYSSKQPDPAVTDSAPSVGGEVTTGGAQTPVDGGKRIKLGEINARIAPLSITADGLAQIGFPPSGTEKNAKLYRECDFPAIVEAIIGRLHVAMNERRAA